MLNGRGSHWLLSNAVLIAPCGAAHEKLMHRFVTV